MKMLIQFGDTTLMKSEFIIIIIIIIFLLLLFVDDVVVGVGIYTYADSNEEVRAKIQQVTGPHEDFLTIVKRRKLQRCGHVSRSSGLAKTILQGTVIGGRRQGRQRKTWEDNISEWTVLELANFPEGSGEQGKMGETVCEIIRGAPTTLAVKG